MQSSVLSALTTASDLIGGYYCLSHEESEVRILHIGTFTHRQRFRKFNQGLKVF